MNIGRFLGFVLAGGLWEAFGRERAAPLIERGATRLVDIGEELVEGYKGGRAGTLVGSSARRTTTTAKRPVRAPAAPKPAAAPKPKGRPPSQATMEKRKKEAQLANLAKARAARRRNLAAKKTEGK